MEEGTGTTWLEYAIDFEMATRSMLRLGGAGAPPNDMNARAKLMSYASQVIWRLAGITKPALAKVDSITPFGFRFKDRCGTRRAAVLLCAPSLMHELYAQAIAKQPKDPSERRSFGWHPFYRNLPKVIWNPVPSGAVRPAPLLRLRAKTALVRVRFRPLLSV